MHLPLSSKAKSIAVESIINLSTIVRLFTLDREGEEVEKW